MRHSDDAIAPDAGSLEPTAIPAPSGGGGARRSRALPRWQGATFALFAGALVFGACQGDNLWSGNSESLQPKVVGIAVPATVYPGDTLQVQVSAYGARQIASISVQLAGAVTLDTTITVTPAATVASTLKVPLPSFLADTLLVIRALAYDKSGAISRMRSDTTKAIAPPAIIEMSGPDSVRPGSAMKFSVRASGVRPVSKIRFALRGAVSRLDSIMVLQPRKDVSESITFPLAVSDVVDTMMVVDVQAVDNSGLEGFITRGSVPVAVPAPVIVLLTAPDSVRAGGSLDVSVDARGLRNLTRLAFSLRRAVTKDMELPVTNPARSITQSASFAIPSDAQDSVVRLSVSAIDAAGKSSVPTIKDVIIPTGLPVVDSLIVGDSIRPGTILDARVYAHGSRNLTRIDLSLRGALNQDVNAVPTPPRSNVTQDFAVPIPEVTSDTLLVVMAKATDAGGNVSAIKQKVIKLSDTALPTVTAVLSASSAAAGSHVGVHIVAKDNVGLGSVGVRLLDKAGLQVGGDSAAASGRMRDTVFSVLVPMVGPQQLTVLGYAYDRGGRLATAAPLILTVVDSIAPLVDITSPVPNATVPIGDSVAVTVNVTDLVGIKSIALSGISIRTSATADPKVVQRFVAKTVSFPLPPSRELPLNPTITRYLLPVNDTIAEQVGIVALVTDSLGNIGVDTAYVNMGGPRVEIRSPSNGSPPMALGLPLQVRLFALDRSSGIDSVRLDITGATRDSLKCGTGSVPACGAPSPDSVVWNPSFTPAIAGQYTLTATAWNRRGIVGRAPQAVTITVVTSGGTSDTQRPVVQIAGITFRGKPLADLTRVELTDSIAVQLKAIDNGSSGLKHLGMTVIAIPNGSIPGMKPDTQHVRFSPAQAGEANATFYVLPRHFGLTERSALLGKALSVQLQFSAFAQDGAGNCGATPQLAVYDSIPCAFAYKNAEPVPDTFFTAAGRTGVARTIALVGGRSLSLPGGGKVVDAVVDAPRQQIYLSNIMQNKVDILRLTDTTFVATGGAARIGLVGSQPWGIFLNGGGDSLFVANSGSTNLSVLRLVADGSHPALTEDLNRRIFTPNEVLWQVQQIVTNGFIRYTATYLDFSDRPQFVAQDVQGRLVYSTVPTAAATDGTLRFVRPNAPPMLLEPRMLLTTKAIDPAATTSTAIARLDSLVVVRGGLVSGDDGVVLYDHQDGYPNDPTRVFQSPVLALPLAIAFMQAHVPPSDLVAYAGRWNAAGVGMSDTTFMAAAGNRTWVAFGEGATSPNGRIMMWDGAKALGSEQISSEVSVQDLVNNASERVFGLGLNLNGTLGVARGTSGAYFFKPDLRLQGLFLSPGSAGGAAMHPNNNAVVDNVNGLAFISTPNFSVKILDSVHFFERGEIQLRDNIVGPVKAGLPTAAENAGLAVTDGDYILAKLYCVTGDASGNTQVVMVNVRNKDLTN